MRWGARRHRSPRKHRRVHFQARRAAQIVADPFRATDPDWAAATAWSNRADEPQGMCKTLQEHADCEMCGVSHSI